MSYMIGDPSFVDTNVLVYLFDSDAPARQAIARDLVDNHAAKFVLSPQVLGEFFVVVTRKLDKPLSPERGLEAVDKLCHFRVRPVNAQLARQAVRRSVSSRLSYWDALIVETALDAGAVTLLTEDLQHGQEFAGMRVVNPFRQLAASTDR